MSLTERDGRLGVGVIGDAPLGPVIARGLASAGHAVIGAAVSTPDARERVQTMIHGAPLLTEAEVVERSELVVLAFPDDELEAGIRRLTEARAWVAGQLVLHLSPEHGTAILAGAFDQGVIPLAIHPAIDVTGTSLDLARIAEGWCAVTAPRPVLPIAQALVVELGAEPVVIAERDRSVYAEAIRTATTFTRSIVGQATELLRGIGIEEPGFVLSSLVRSAADNALADASASRLDPRDAADRPEPGDAAGAPGASGAPGADHADPTDAGGVDPAAA